MKEALILLPFSEKWPYNGHLWYLYALLGIYFVLPILKKMLRNLEQSDYIYLLFIWLVFSVISPSLSYYIPSLSLNSYKIILPVAYFCYLLLGYYLDKYTSEYELLNNKQLIILLWVGLIISLLITWILTWHHNLHSTKLVGIYLSDLNIFVVLISSIVFILVRLFLNRSSKVIGFLSKLSFIAYCCHIVVQNILNMTPIFKPILDNFNAISTTIGILFKFSFVVVISYLIAYLLSLLTKKIGYYFGV